MHPMTFFSASISYRSTAAGVSYWMHVGEQNHGITIEAVQERNQHKYPRKDVCNIKVDAEAQEANDYAQIGLDNRE